MSTTTEKIKTLAERIALAISSESPNLVLIRTYHKEMGRLLKQLEVK